MNHQLKRRLLITVIIVALAVIFLPIPFGHLGQKKPVEAPTAIPPTPSMPVPADAPSAALIQPQLAQAPTQSPVQAQTAPAPVMAALTPATPAPSAVTPSVPVTEAPAKSSPHPKKVVHPHPPRSVIETSPAGNWFVQVGSFPEKSLSQGVVRNLQSKGFHASIHQAQVKGRLMYRVYVGPYHNEAAATQKLNQIKTQMNLSGFVHEIKDKKE